MINNWTQNDRLDWIDTIKGIGIILVVVGHHLRGLSWINTWISSFHMPLFFLVTGYLYAYRQSWNFSIHKFFTNKIKGLLYPYATLSLIILIWHFVFYNIFFTNSHPESSTIEVFLLTITTYGYHALWFLPCLFLSSILFHLITKHNVHHLVCIFLMISLVLVNYILVSNYITIDILRTLDATVYIYFGYLFFLLLQKKRFIQIALLIISVSIIVLSFIILHFFPSYFPRLDIRTGKIGNVLGYFFSLSICFVIFWLCKKINILNHIFGFWGKYSIIIMALHMDISIEISYLIVSKFPFTLNDTSVSIFAIIIEFVLFWFIILVMRKYSPFLYSWHGLKSQK